MRIIIDSNVLFSALIKDSFTRKLIFEYDNSFLFPFYIFEEMQKHYDELLEKSGMSTADFNKLLKILLKKVKIVPTEVLLPYKEEALEIVKDIDISDVLFVACALAYARSVIWSDDKKLKNQTKVQVINTKEFIDFVMDKG
ncbi:MAG: PIN domain-containing protein [archaeon]|nr:PIN domain-containing protein [Nanoarchaeota archaeon]